MDSGTIYILFHTIYLAKIIIPIGVTIHSNDFPFYSILTISLHALDNPHNGYSLNLLRSPMSYLKQIPLLYSCNLSTVHIS